MAKLGAGKPLGPQAGLWLPLLIVAAVLAGLAGYILSSAFNMCGCSWRVRIAIFVAAALLLLLPGIMSYKAIRRKLKTGSFLPSQEELAASRAKCAQPKSLRRRIAMAGMWWFNAIVLTDSTIHRHYPYHGLFGSPWVGPVMASFAAVIWTVQIFQPSRPACGLPLSVVPREPAFRDSGS